MVERTNAHLCGDDILEIQASHLPVSRRILLVRQLSHQRHQKRALSRHIMQCA